MAKRSLLRRLGPGLITGAADDDPSGIATYSQAGAQFSFGLLWTMALTYPLMSAVQLISAKIGRVTGTGLATNMARVMPRWLLVLLVGLVFLANTINVGADLSAMGEAGQLATKLDARLLTIGFAVVSLLLQIFLPYASYARFLKWLTLSLLAYLAALLMIKIDWAAAGKGLVLPEISGKKAILMVVAIFGTTISPFLFFWQAAQEVEEIDEKPSAKPLQEAPAQASDEMSRMRFDTFVGMAVSNIIAIAIMISAAATLHEHGKTDIATAADAAKALEPAAGQYASALFSLGIIGTGLLAIPVLAGSAGYALATTFKWECSLNAKPNEAPRFYFVIAACVILGLGVEWSPIPPMKALVWSAVVNGVVAVPIMVALMIVAARESIMGRFVVSGVLKALGWLATAVMAASIVAMTIVG